MAQCKATTKTGRPCPNPARDGGEFCGFHDPDLAAVRAEARRRGGHNRRTRRAPGHDDPPASPLRSVDDVQCVLERTLADTLAQENSGSRTQALVRVCVAALKAIEVGEIEERVAALEARLSEGGSRR